MRQQKIIQERQDEVFLTLANIVESQGIEEDDLALVNGQSAYNPVMMYFSNRKGWSASEKNIFTEGFIEQRIYVDLEYVIIDKRRPNKKLPYKIIFENEDFLIYNCQTENEISN